MKYSGTMDDFQEFEKQLEAAIEKGILKEDGDPVGFDVDLARESVIDMLDEWKLIVFLDEN